MISLKLYSYQKTYEKLINKNIEKLFKILKMYKII
jgi:hypothetical protein